MELGLYSFGDSSFDVATGSYQPEKKIYSNLMERIKLADEVGLSYFGIGEHHREDYPVASPAVVLAAGSSVTKNIHLGSAVSILPTVDPVRLFQDFSTLDILSNGRAELTVGTGAFIESYPLFGHAIDEMQPQFTELLELLKILNTQNPVTWQGKFRSPLDNAGIWPRPQNGELDIWVAVGATPESSERAASQGFNANYSFLGNEPAANAHLVEHYRARLTAHGFDPSTRKVAVAGRGFVATDGKLAKETMFNGWLPSVVKVAAERGRPTPDRELYDIQANGAGPIIAGSPSEVVDRLSAIHASLKHDRHILQMNIGNISHSEVMKSIELFGTEVLPQVAHL